VAFLVMLSAEEMGEVEEEAGIEAAEVVEGVTKKEVLELLAVSWVICSAEEVEEAVEVEAAGGIEVSRETLIVVILAHLMIGCRTLNSGPITALVLSMEGQAMVAEMRTRNDLMIIRMWSRLTHSSHTMSKVRTAISRTLISLATTIRSHTAVSDRMEATSKLLSNSSPTTSSKLTEHSLRTASNNHTTVSNSDRSMTPSLATTVEMNSTVIQPAGTVMGLMVRADMETKTAATDATEASWAAGVDDL